MTSSSTGAGPPETAGRPGDAARRTHLANERTYLAWWRTGITSLAAGVGVGRIVPSLTHQDRWPYAVLGAGFALIGLLAIAYGFLREREVEAAVERGRFVLPRVGVLAALTAGGILLGLMLLVVVLVQL